MLAPAGTKQAGGPTGAVFLSLLLPQEAIRVGAVSKLPVAALKPWLRARGLPVSGTKAELVERILGGHVKQENG